MLLFFAQEANLVLEARVVLRANSIMASRGTPHNAFVSLRLSATLQLYRPICSMMLIHMRISICADLDHENYWFWSSYFNICIIRQFIRRLSYLGNLPVQCFLVFGMVMMTSSNKSIFRVTGALWRTFTGHRCISLSDNSKQRPYT